MLFTNTIRLVASLLLSYQITALPTGSPFCVASPDSGKKMSSGPMGANNQPTETPMSFTADKTALLTGESVTVTASEAVIGFLVYLEDPSGAKVGTATPVAGVSKICDGNGATGDNTYTHVPGTPATSSWVFTAAVDIPSFVPKGILVKQDGAGFSWSVVASAGAIAATDQAPVEGKGTQVELPAELPKPVDQNQNQNQNSAQCPPPVTVTVTEQAAAQTTIKRCKPRQNTSVAEKVVVKGDVAVEAGKDQGVEVGGVARKK